MEKNEYYKMYRFENDYWWYRGLHELVTRFVSAYANKHKNPGTGKSEPSGLHIFDAGCGTGRMMELLNSFGTVVGIDYSEEAVALCKERGLENAGQGDLNKWEPRDGVYDVIISNDVICTSGIDDDMEVITKFAKALKKDGIMILNLPAFKMLRRRHDIAVFGKRRYRKHETLSHLKEMGLVPLRASYRLPFLFLIIILQKNLIERFSKNSQVESDLKPLPSLINNVLLFLNRVENFWISLGLPVLFGSSLFLVMKKGEAFFEKTAPPLPPRKSV